MRDLDGEFRELPSGCVRGPERVRGNSEDWGKGDASLRGRTLGWSVKDLSESTFTSLPVIFSC